jgi:hypothetical protein
MDEIFYFAQIGDIIAVYTKSGIFKNIEKKIK